MNSEIADLYTPQGLVELLKDCDESEYIRAVAMWLSRVKDWQSPAKLDGNDVANALVAAATSHAALKNGAAPPAWASGHALPSFWHKGPPGLFAYSFAHTPGSFQVRGIVVDAAALESI